jgi:hypothetical protein
MSVFPISLTNFSNILISQVYALVNYISLFLNLNFNDMFCNRTISDASMNFVSKLIFTGTFYERGSRNLLHSS